MCRIFWGPDIKLCSKIMTGEFFHPFDSLLQKSHEEQQIMDNIKLVTHGFNSADTLFERLDQCYIDLFINSRDGIKAPLYESCYMYENAPMMGKPALDMMDRFKSKELSMEHRLHEPPDHIAIELEYLFFLLQEEDVLSGEAASFANKTMLPWVKLIIQRLESVSGTCKFYYFSGNLLIFILGKIKD